MSYNQYDYYSTKGNRREEQLEKYRNPSISMKELRRLTDTVNEYQRFTNFSKKILDIPLEEISNYTHFNVTYDKIKKGRAIDSIVFHITEKRMADDNSYKQEDETYLEDKARKEADQEQFYLQAMESRYTKILMDHFMLSPYDLIDKAIMAGLQKHVYPLYDELKNLRGLSGVETHVSYVSGKKEGYSKRNIAKYLKKAIEQYLITVKIQDKMENGSM